MAKPKSTRASASSSPAQRQRGGAGSGRRSGAMEVDLVMQVHDRKPPIKRWLVEQLKRIAALAGIDRGRVALLIVGDDEMARLHEQYKQSPGTTDVLTFDLRESPADAIEGDIALCIDEAARQAQSRGHEVRLELLLYAVHGLLHLCGYDDQTRAQYARMHRREDELLEKAGLGPVFRG